MPPFLYDIMRVLLLLTGPAAFICLLNAGIALRKEGGTVFWVGGGFSKWMLGVIFLGLEPTLTLFQFLGARCSSLRFDDRDTCSQHSAGCLNFRQLLYIGGSLLAAAYLSCARRRYASALDRDVHLSAMSSCHIEHHALSTVDARGDRFSVALALESWDILASRIMPTALARDLRAIVVRIQPTGYLRW